MEITTTIELGENLRELANDINKQLETLEKICTKELEHRDEKIIVALQVNGPQLTGIFSSSLLCLDDVV